MAFFAVEDSGVLSSKKKKSAQPKGTRLCIERLAEQFYNGSEGASGVFVQSYLNSGDRDPLPRPPTTNTTALPRDRPPSEPSEQV